MVSTDGRRLAVCAKKIISKEREFSVIVPTKVLSELLRLVALLEIEEKDEDKLLIAVTDNQITFQLKETTTRSFFFHLLDKSAFSFDVLAEYFFLFRFQPHHRTNHFFQRNTAMLKSVFIIIIIIIIIVRIQEKIIFTRKNKSGTHIRAR